MDPKPGILIVDDEVGMRRLMVDILESKTPYGAVATESGREAIDLLRRELERRDANGARFSLVVTDLLMPGMDGSVLLEKIHELDASLPVMVVTSHGSIDSAVDLVRRGASDYLTKPFTPMEFVQRVERILDNRRLQEENARLRQRLHQRDSTAGVIGQSAPITRVLRTAAVAAKSDALVMMCGESGTGKEVIARTIHALSPRASAAFVTVNCGALPETLLENELFGHVRGAYSDAHADRLGLVAEAEGGTLFLDEIGDITPGIQVKLLRFLQDKEFKRLGHTKVSKADVRLIAATNKDLQEEMRLGRFREDLYYRLNIIPITIPPLRDRREDIPLRVDHVLSRVGVQLGRLVPAVAPRALQKLIGYEWPGNVRELENKIHQVVVMTTKKVLQPEDFILTGGHRTDRLFARSLKEAKREMIDEFERGYISAALSAHRGNVSRAARQAGKNRRAFFELMRRHRIDPTPFRSGNGSSS
jgi:two-component system response regulator GlrR